MCVCVCVCICVFVYVLIYANAKVYIDIRAYTCKCLKSLGLKFTTAELLRVENHDEDIPILYVVPLISNSYYSFYNFYSTAIILLYILNPIAI